MKRTQRQIYTNVVKQKNKLLFWFVVIAALLASVFAVGLIFRYIESRKSLEKDVTVEELQQLWTNGDYETVFTRANILLETKPVHQAALVYRGYSSFYLAVSQTDTTAALSYIEDAINSLRIALISNKTKSKGQIEYMLAKTYFQKNAFSSYNYYADLVIKYFLQAQQDGFYAKDIPEYLGLTYASLNMIDESISAFTEALTERESETLLNAIGEQYYKSGDYARAKQYLFRIVNESKDDLLVLKSRNILGKIYLEQNNLNDAKNEFEAILKKDEYYADAYYGLGVIYEKQGDLIKARSEWRKALRMQVNHPGAIQKLNND